MIKKYLFLFTFFVFIICNAQWEQVGNDIIGNPGDAAGITLTDLNSSGNRIAVANPYSDTGDPNAGHVRVYDLVANEWVQVGPYLQGIVYPSEAFGISIDMNGSGEYVAVGIGENGIGEGRAGVYEYDGVDWILKGGYFSGESTGDDLGEAIALSDDGQTVAISAPGDDGNGTSAGQVRVYQFQTGSWAQIGQDINGLPDDELGNALSINANGNILAIAAHFAETINGYYSGKVMVYENQNGTWVQLGSDINGTNGSDILGRSIDLNAGGDRLVIGVPGVDYVGEDNKGAVKVYEYDGNNWILLGEEIPGNLRQNGFGQSVGINDDGDTIIIGAPYSDPNNPYEGEAWFYKYNGQQWLQYGSSLIGTEYGDKLGANVSISSSGDFIGVASWGSEIIPGDKTGKVNVYNTELLMGSQDFVNYNAINIFPNPIQNVMFLESTSEPLKEVTIYSQLGQELYNIKIDEINATIDLSSYSNGIYFVKVQVGNETIIKKVFKN